MLSFAAINSVVEGIKGRRFQLSWRLFYSLLNFFLEQSDWLKHHVAGRYSTLQNTNHVMLIWTQPDSWQPTYAAHSGQISYNPNLISSDNLIRISWVRPLEYFVISHKSEFCKQEHLLFSNLPIMLAQVGFFCFLIASGLKTLLVCSWVSCD